jgi:hypothetical protein
VGLVVGDGRNGVAVGAGAAAGGSELAMKRSGVVCGGGWGCIRLGTGCGRGDGGGPLVGGRVLIVGC